MVPKQGLEKAEAACLLSNNDYTFPPHIMQLSNILRSGAGFSSETLMAMLLSAETPRFETSMLGIFLKCL